MRVPYHDASEVRQHGGGASRNQAGLIVVRNLAHLYRILAECLLGKPQTYNYI